MTKLYGIKNCDTMKKAMNWLSENGVAYEFIDYKKAGVAEANLPDWNARAGWEKLLNTRGLMWKKLSEEERAAVDEQKALKLMAQYPSLIKRPVLDAGSKLLVGFSPEGYAEQLEMSDSTVRRFLFEHLDIRGAIVHLGDSWQQMQVDRDYQPTVAQLLGETATVTALIAAQLKQPGRLTLQLRGNGPIQLLVMDCNEQLQMRGMARSNPVVLPAPVPELLGANDGGQLMLSLDMPDARHPYQSFVPLVGDSIAAIFEHYLEQSEQQPSRLFVTAGPGAAACLFLQKMPAADHHDADGWHRITQLAATVKPAELLELDAEALLGRLFHEDMAAHGVRVYDPLPVVYHCPQDWTKVRDMIRSLGREDAETILREHGEILIRDDICNHEYRFTPEDVAELFSSEPTLH